MALKKKYQDQLLSIIRKHVPHGKVYLFGSRATGQERISSDIDIAIDAHYTLSFKLILSLLADIDETSIPMKVDIVDFNCAPEELKQNIINKGELWTK